MRYRGDPQNGIGSDWRPRRISSVLPDTGEDIQVKEMHSAQGKQHPAQLVTQQFNACAPVGDDRIAAQGQRDKPDIDQVKAHHQQMVHRSRQLGIALNFPLYSANVKPLSL